ncbi:hypothetical protein CYK57_01058 [Actinobacillus pleuropneumoniae]|nr:hypothetical protein appser9_9720 [Actinobacillus pleuropneumoniae serovar 9 str. CVJ13261]QSZ38921.1 hypothetical protein CYK57_01058 [Actinobacillus pleuropneumoniae]
MCAVIVSPLIRLDCKRLLFCQKTVDLQVGKLKIAMYKYD